MIIGISGRMGSGKDTVANMIREIDTKYRTNNTGIVSPAELQADSKWEIKKYAGALKKIASILTGVPEAMFEIPEFKEKDMPESWRHNNGYLMTYREFLQRLGTEAVRNNIHHNAWVNALMSHCTYKDNWIITDVRFNNEMDAIRKKNGFILRVTRPDAEGKAYHISETELDNASFDYVIENEGSMTELRNKVEQFMWKFNLIDLHPAFLENEKGI
jgi:hypothetical protein